MRNASTRFSTDLRYRDGEHPAQTWFTPSYVLDPIRFALGGVIGLDPCTTPDNPVRAERFYTVEDDGLTQPWSGPEWSPTVFVNPPYSKAREPWVEKCIEAGRRGQKVVLLVPAATDTRIVQKALVSSTVTLFVRGRVKFGIPRPNGRQVAASHPSAIFGWNTELKPAGALGVVMQRA